ncbi:MAG: hypothetical protein OEW58_12050 [Gammaproteobacteria bacterium]|nr:hypothetical protein [Gammaproteobacteria bacterium]
MKKLLVLLASLQLIGCASMFNNKVQPVMVQTEDSVKIQARIDTPERSYNTRVPAMILSEPSSFDQLVVQLTDPCFPKNRYVARKTVDSSYFANLLNGHGFYIDYLNGNMWNYDSQLYIPLGNQDRLNDCTSDSPEQQVSDNSAPIGVNTAKLLNHALYLGFVVSQESSSIDGGKLGYQRHLNSRMFIDFQSGSTNNDRSFWEPEIFVSKQTLALSINYYPWQTTTLYLGAGLAQEKIQAEYDPADWLAPTETIYREQHTPAFINIGWHNARNNRFFVNVYTAIDLEDFQLSSYSRNPRGSSRWDNLPADKKRDALAQLEQIRRYTHAGFDFGFRF